MQDSTSQSLRNRDFLDLADLEPDELRHVLALAHAVKAGRFRGRPLVGRHLALLFQKPSHRTRLSFEVGITRLGGTLTSLTDREVQFGVRESVADAARVLDRYADGVVARLHSHEDLVRLAQASRRPVINGLTDRSHPCQVLADLMTLEELKGDLSRQTVVFIGDGNNVATSLIEAAALTGFSLTVVTPPGYDPPAAALDRARMAAQSEPRIHLTHELAGFSDATAIYTDVWASMGHEDEADSRRAAFRDYQVTQAVMDAAPGAVFMHCLPAHRGEEVADAVMDGPRSIVFQQAENRLYAQMALMASIFGPAT